MPDRFRNMPTSRGVLGKLIGTDQRAKGFAPEHRVFVGIELLEDRGLVPHLAFVILQRIGQLIFLDVQHPDLQLLVGLGVIDQIMQPAPGPLHLAHFVAMQDLIHLFTEKRIDARDQRLDRFHSIARNRGRPGPFLCSQCQVRHQILQLVTFLVLDPEILFQQFGEFPQIKRFRFGDACTGFLFLFGHDQPSSPSVAFIASSAAWARSGSLFRSWAMRFSASTLPSI